MKKQVSVDPAASADGCQTRCWFDATTLFRLRGFAPVGLSRVEANVLSGAIRQPAESTRFCVYDRYKRSFNRIEEQEIRSLLEGYGGAGNAKARKIGQPHFLKRCSREFERRVRLGVRKTAAWAKKQAAGLGIGTLFRPGDLFVVSGSTWDVLDAELLNQLSSEGVRVVVILADMIPWRFPHQFHDRVAVDRFLGFAEFMAREAALVVSISEATKADFLEFCDSLGVTPPPTEVVLLGADPPRPAEKPAWFPADADERGFVLSVSTIQVRKNHQLLYQLWRRFAEEHRTDTPRLVLVGSNGWLTDDLRIQMRLDPLVRDSILVQNHVGDEELSWLYENCRFTLYPSLYEGWGLPIVESLYHGKACLASSTSSMPEAGGGLARHLDPLDFAGWYRTIRQWIEQPEVLAAEEARISAEFQPRPWSDFSTQFLDRVQSLVAQQGISSTKRRIAA